MTLRLGNDYIKVGDLGSRSRNTFKPNGPDKSAWAEQEPAISLIVSINGRVAGLIHFQRSARLEASSVLKRLRSKHNVQIGVVSHHPCQFLTPFAASLGADFHLGDLTPDDRISLLKNCRQRGFKVAYLGDCRIDPRITAEAHVAISLVEQRIHNLDNDRAPIQLLHTRLSNLGELWDIASIHHRRLRIAHSYALLPNLLCIAGAFLWNFTSLASVIVTNLGTYGLYLRTATSICALERQVSRSLHLQSYSGESH